MRTLLLIPVVATLAGLAACDDAQPTTAPARAHTAPAPAAQASVDAPTNQAKPAPAPVGFTTVTVVTSTEFESPGGAVAGSILCPAGTTRTGGGYAFVMEGNWSAPPVVTQNMPIPNGWWVRVVNSMVGHQYATFRVYALCAS